MIKVHSRSDNNMLLHILYRKDEFSNRQDIIEANQFLQVASLKLINKQTFQAHKHLWKNSNNKKIIAQESWVVIKGKIKVDYYDLDDQLLESFILSEGDCTITLYGGHNYTSLADDTLVYEFKTGPYIGQSNDKQHLKL